MPMPLPLLFVAMMPLASNADARVLPTQFEAHRVFVVPRLGSGGALKLYTDSGGGANLLCRSAAEREHLPLMPFSDKDAQSELGANLAKTAFPAFKSGFAIPANVAGDRSFLVYDCKPHRGMPADALGDGMLSSRWFGDRIWTWNYTTAVLQIEPASFRPDVNAQKIALGFATGEKGKREGHFPRMTVQIDGESFDMLLDTGAFTQLQPAAKTEMHDDLPAIRATSFMSHGHVEQWHRTHPEWRVMEKAETGTDARMIEVPSMKIAGIEIGPVWFTERSDDDFHTFMSRMMDKTVEGAIGGNALYHFVMTVDYPNAVAYFRCTMDCTVKPPPVP